MPLALDAAQLPTDAIEVGRIGEAWGIKGWFKVHAFNSNPQAFFSSKNWYLAPPNPPPHIRINFTAFEGTVLLQVLQAKEHADGIVATSTQISDRAAAESLKGARIFIPRSKFPTPEKDEFYWVDLIGCQVINREGVVLGVVNDLQTTGSHAVLILGKLMIPFVNAYIDDVDLAHTTIRVDWQEHYLT